jgi:thioredoxin 1
VLTELTDDNLEEHLSRAQSPVLLYFWAPWSQPCRNLDAAMTELAKELEGRLSFYRINIDECAHAPAQYGIKYLPHLTFIREGRVTDRLEGRHPLSHYRDFIEKNMTSL